MILCAKISFKSQHQTSLFIKVVVAVAANDGAPSSPGRYGTVGLVLSFIACFILLAIAP